MLLSKKIFPDKVRIACQLNWRSQKENYEIIVNARANTHTHTQVTDYQTIWKKFI